MIPKEYKEQSSATGILPIGHGCAEVAMGLLFLVKAWRGVKSFCYLFVFLSFYLHCEGMRKMQGRHCEGGSRTGKIKEEVTSDRVWMRAEEGRTRTERLRGNLRREGKMSGWSREGHK